MGGKKVDGRIVRTYFVTQQNTAYNKTAIMHDFRVLF